MLELWNHFVIGPMTWGLNEFAYYLWGSYALAIIAFTIVIKMALYPLTIKQLRSARAQQALQPQMQALRAKYANDKQTLNTEMMRLYKENNANPAAGCLPMVVQFPILIGLYNALYGLFRTEHVQASFLWIHNLALPDFWSVANPANPSQMIYNGLFILPLLAGGLQFIQQRMMMNPAANQDPQQKMMNQMMQFMPLMVIFFGFRFPAGLALYWVTNTLVAIFQQYFVTGWGSLVLLIPALRNVPTPGAGKLGPPPPTPPTVTARDTLPAAKPAAKRETAGRAPTARPTTTEQDAAPPTPTSNGVVHRGKTPPGNGVRRQGPDGSRPRPPARKQGSKR